MFRDTTIQRFVMSQDITPYNSTLRDTVFCNVISRDAMPRDTTFHDTKSHDTMFRNTKF